MCNHESNVPFRLSPQWLCGNSCTWAHGIHDVYTSCSIWYKLIHFSLLLTLQYKEWATQPVFCIPDMEQVESHLHFMFYCKLSKVTLDYISELINLNYSFNLPFKFSLKTIKIGSFSILWWCTFKNSTHTFRSDTHASLQSLQKRKKVKRKNKISEQFEENKQQTQSFEEIGIIFVNLWWSS